MMIEILNAMIDRAPRKARAIQKQGPKALEDYARNVALRAAAEAKAQNVPANDPNRARMVREIALQNAIEEAISDETPQETT